LVIKYKKLNIQKKIKQSNKFHINNTINKMQSLCDKCSTPLQSRCGHCLHSQSAHSYEPPNKNFNGRQFYVCRQCQNERRGYAVSYHNFVKSMYCPNCPNKT
jgi:hypothetical protein